MLKYAIFMNGYFLIFMEQNLDIFTICFHESYECDLYGHAKILGEKTVIFTYIFNFLL